MEEHECTGTESCPYAWHIAGCAPFWQYSLEGQDISGDPYAAEDADEKRLWTGPDEPAEVWTRHRYRPKRSARQFWSTWERVE